MKTRKSFRKLWKVRKSSYHPKSSSYFWRKINSHPTPQIDSYITMYKRCYSIYSIVKLFSLALQKIYKKITDKGSFHLNVAKDNLETW
jgi:hypothetical protein